MYVSLQSLGIFLVLFVLFIAGIFLIFTLNNVNKLIFGINKRLNENEQNIQDTINNVTSSMKNINELSTSLYLNKDLLEVQIPGTINNVHALSTSLKNAGAKVDYSVGMVNASLVETASTVQENTQDILGYVRIVSESLRIFLEMFSSKK